MTSGTPVTPVLQFRDIVEPITLLVPPATALAFYFGWRRTDVFLAYFGIRNSMVGFGFNDYVIRSAATVYRLVLTAVLACLALYGIHLLLRHMIARRALHRAILWSLAGLVVAGLGIAILGAVTKRGLTSVSVVLTRETLLAGGIALGIYAVPLYLKSQRALLTPVSAGDVSASGAHSSEGLTKRNWAVIRVLAWMLVFIGLFSATEALAKDIGGREARRAALLLESRGEVTVYATRDLGLPKTVTCVELRGQRQAFRYRCPGLRLFLRDGDRLLLLPARWSREDGIDAADQLIVLRDGPELRFEFAPGVGDLL